MKNPKQTVREITESSELYLRGGSVELTLGAKIARELEVRQELEEKGEDEDGPLVNQRTDPDHPGRVILEIVD